MIKKKGFLLAEACVALIIAAVSVEVLFFCVGQTKTVRQAVEARLERAYAWHVLKTTSRRTITVRDQSYRLKGNKKLQNPETGKIYEIR